MVSASYTAGQSRRGGAHWTCHAPSQTQAGGVVPNLGGALKEDLPVRLRMGVKEKFFFTILRARSRIDLGNQRRCE